MESRFHKKVIVIGAGAAGMMAAAWAAEGGAEVMLLEKNSRPGRKIGITGKGRCNVTNADELPEVLKNVISNPRFLYSALYGFSNRELMERIEAMGVPLKIERGNRVFPVSDNARDIIDALCKMVKRSGAKLFTGVEVCHVEPDGGLWHVTAASGQVYTANAVIIASGGCSYPGTGSTGDGFTWARELGHQIEKLRPGLIPLRSNASWIPSLQGISLRNVRAEITEKEKKVLELGMGEMLFTHFGLSGPLILSASSRLQKLLADENKKWKEAGYVLHIDLKPALSASQLDQRLIRDFELYKAKSMEKAMKDLVPQRMIPVLLAESGVDSQRCAGELTRKERLRIGAVLKDLRCPLTGTRPMEEAIITMGGVDTKEISPKTMESRIHPGLYFAGEVLDIDALTGGYNLQLAFSTGAAAGKAAARE